jgi:hypothetical protein
MALKLVPEEFVDNLVGNVRHSVFNPSAVVGATLLALLLIIPASTPESGSDNTVRVDETDYKKAILVSECIVDEPAELVQEAKSKLSKLHEDFLVANELYPEPTLEEYNYS